MREGGRVRFEGEKRGKAVRETVEGQAGCGTVRVRIWGEIEMRRTL